MSADPARSDAVRYWWSRSAESLEAARRELEAGDYPLAINRVYYALFYAVSALLLEEGRDFKKHAGVRAVFNREIIKTGRLGRQHGDLYNRVFGDRLKGDYLVFSEFDRAYVQRQIGEAEAFLVDLRPMLKSV